MGGKRSREKGIEWEQEIAREHRGLFPKAGRGIAQTQGGSDAASDVEGCGPYSIECKWVENLSLRASWAQAKARAAACGKIPVLAIKQTVRATKFGAPPPPLKLVAVELSDWIDMQHKLHGLNDIEVPE